LLWNCVDNQLFRFNDQKKFDNNKIICVARLVPIKNIQNLLRAWKFVEENNDSNTLIILGDGPLIPSFKSVLAALTLLLNNTGKPAAMASLTTKPQLSPRLGNIKASASYKYSGILSFATAPKNVTLLSLIDFAKLFNSCNNGYIFNPDDLAEMEQKLIDFINLSDSAKKEMSANSLKIIGAMSYENMGNELLKTINFLKTKPDKKSSLLPYIAINLWYGRNNTLGWDMV